MACFRWMNKKLDAKHYDVDEGIRVMWKGGGGGFQKMYGVTMSEIMLVGRDDLRMAQIVHAKLAGRNRGVVFFFIYDRYGIYLIFQYYTCALVHTLVRIHMTEKTDYQVRKGCEMLYVVADVQLLIDVAGFRCYIYLGSLCMSI